MTAALSYRQLDTSSAPELLAISRACPIESRFTFRFDRDPDFFAWPSAVFDSFQYLGVFAGDRLVGYCMAGYRRGWTGEDWGRWGYVGDVRLLPEFRGGHVIQEAFDQLAAAAPDDVNVGFFIVNRGNAIGSRIAQHLRAGSFAATHEGTLDVVSLPILGASVREADSIRDARPKDIQAATFLVREGSAGRLFASCPQETAAFGIDDNVLVASIGGRVRGVISWRDLGDVRRTTIVSYPLAYWPVRIAWCAARLVRSGIARLPRPGESMRAATVTHLAARNDDLAVLRSLVLAATARLAGRGTHLLQLGGMTGEPCLEALKGLPRFHFRSDVWLLSKQPVTPSRPPFVDLRII